MNLPIFINFCVLFVNLGFVDMVKINIQNSILSSSLEQTYYQLPQYTDYTISFWFRILNLDLDSSSTHIIKINN